MNHRHWNNHTSNHIYCQIHYLNCFESGLVNGFAAGAFTGLGNADHFTVGDQLQPRDMVFFTKYTNPRRLNRWLDNNTWIGCVIWYGHDNSIAPEQQITINPGRWYVVKRK